MLKSHCLDTELTEQVCTVLKSHCLDTELTEQVCISSLQLNIISHFMELIIT